MSERGAFITVLLCLGGWRGNSINIYMARFAAKAELGSFHELFLKKLAKWNAWKYNVMMIVKQRSTSEYDRCDHTMLAG